MQLQPAEAPQATALPLRTAVEILGALEAPDPHFTTERPLFAAIGEFAHDHGGPVTRAFLDRLPASFRRQALVVDSALVWLQRGQGLATRWYHHEPFPGETRYAYGAANREAATETIACALGAPSHRDFLAGDLSGLDAAIHCVEPRDFVVRDGRLRALVESGRLAKVRVPIGALHRYSAGAFLRVVPSDEAGFHFHIRVTRGSARPIVNGFRNSVGGTVTGPWQQEFVP